MLVSLRLVAAFILSLAGVGHALAQSITVLPSVTALHMMDNTAYQYVFVQNPDPTATTPANNGGGLFVRLQTTSSTATQCVGNGVTVVLDTVGNCFVRTGNLNLRDFGAKGDTRSGFVDGAFMTSTLFCSGTSSSSTAGFSSADVNKHIYIQGAGSSFTPASSAGNPNVGPHFATFDTTVASYSIANPNCVTLATGGQAQGIWGSVLGPTVVTKPTPIRGAGYSPGDTLALASGVSGGTLLNGTTYCSSNKPNADPAMPGSGTPTCAATLKVNVVTVVSASVASSGSGATKANSTCTLTGMTGTALSGQLVQVSVATDASGHISTGPIPASSISNAGLYTALPTYIATEPTTGCTGITGAQLSLTFGVAQASLIWNGMYSKLPTATQLGVSALSHPLISPMRKIR